MTTQTAISPIEALNVRLEKARSIVSEGKVHPIVGMEGHYAVECSRMDGSMYLVNGTCTCVDAQQRVDVHHGWCKHRLAVELYKEQEASRPEEAPVDEELERKIADLY